MDPYELGTASPARRALSDRLPPEVAEAAASFITGPLLENPRQVGKPLRDELVGVVSARLGTSWRVLYEIDQSRHVVVISDIRARSSAYRTR